ncbi:MAG: diguanylate cyclase domain-containing protein [Pyrinomonadaceae bacterium]
MKQGEQNVPITVKRRGPSPTVYTVLIAIGLVAPVVTFAIAVSSLDPQAKIVGLAAMALIYFLICFWSYRELRQEAAIESAAGIAPADAESELNGKLLALEEANEFFGTSLKPADTFRLVSSRIRDIYPHSASVLFVANADRTALDAAQADGHNADQLQNVALENGRGLAGMAYLSGEVEFAADLDLDRPQFEQAALEGLRSAAAVPLSYKQEVFGVIQLFADADIARDDRSRNILEAVGERVAPMLRGSIAFAESLSSALTDSMTSLPNERAFFMILENQLAESLRSREDRPLSVIAIDIKNFDEDDRGYSAAQSEKLFGFVADVVRGQLRKMDFLARSVSDEFLIILPTATESTAGEIMNRIVIAFAQTLFKTSDGDEIKIWINFGCACFWKDGETAHQLLQNARLRKQQAKSEDPEKILRFPKEYVN